MWSDTNSRTLIADPPVTRSTPSAMEPFQGVSILKSNRWLLVKRLGLNRVPDMRLLSAPVFSFARNAGRHAPRAAREAAFPAGGSRKRLAVALDVLIDGTRRMAG